MIRVAAIACVLLSSAAAAAEPEPPRAEQAPGTFVATDANRASASLHVYDNHIGVRGQQVVLAPTIDVFVHRHLTLGAAFAIDYEKYPSAHSLSIGGDGRVGVYQRLARNWALWPTLALGAYHYSTTFPDDNAHLSLRARLDVPLLYYPASGFFLGAGPVVGAVAQSTYGTYDPFVTVGLLTVLGGTF